MLFSILGLLFCGLSGVLSQADIYTTPLLLPNSSLARGYVNLTVTYDLKIATYGEEDNCQWMYTIQGKTRKTRRFAAVNGTDTFCQTHTNETVVCNEEKTENGFKYIMSNITFRQALNDDINISAGCGRNNQTLLNIFVKDCTQTPQDNLFVQADSYSYAANGLFNCSNNGKTFYPNATQPSSKETTCLYSAEWKGLQNLQCWSAPDVSLRGNTVVNEGSNLTLTCDYNDILPRSSATVFYVGDNATTPQGRNYSLVNLHARDHNKQVSCQAITPYTEVFKDSGKSPYINLSVRYAPHQRSLVSCRWILDENDATCHVRYFSNPRATFLSIAKNGIHLNDENIDQSTFEDRDDQHDFLFSRALVSFSDNGTYTIYLQSPLMPAANFSITFDVLVINARGQAESTSLVVGIVCAFLALIVCSVLLVILHLKRRQKDDIKSGQPERISIFARFRQATSRDTTYVQPATIMLSQSPPNQIETTKVEEDYVNLENNVDVSVAEDGYLTLCPLDPSNVGNNTHKPTYESIRIVPHYEDIEQVEEEGNSKKNDD